MSQYFRPLGGMERGGLGLDFVRLERSPELADREGRSDNGVDADGEERVEVKRRETGKGTAKLHEDSDRAVNSAG